MNRIPLREIAPLVRVTFQNWQNDRGPRMGAALAYYMALSLAPSVVIVVAVTGLAFGAEAAQSRVLGQIRGLVGREGAEVIRSAIKGAQWSPHGIAATLVGLATLFFGATAVVIELRQAMHTIW